VRDLAHQDDTETDVKHERSHCRFISFLDLDLTAERRQG